MNRRTRHLALAATVLLPVYGCTQAQAETAPSPANGPSAQQAGSRESGAAGRNGSSDGPKAYEEVITDEAVTQDGMFKVHRIGDDLFFEIPTGELMKEMLLIQRPVESTLQNPGGFFGGGPRLVVQWERMGNRIVLREREYDLMADSTQSIYRAVRPFTKGPVLAAFDVEAYGPDSAAVVDVSDLFVSNIPELGPVEGINRERSWIEQTWAFPRNVDIEVTQTGQARPGGPGGPGGGPGGANRQPQTQTVRAHFSMLRLPDDPMMPRWEDERVGFISSDAWDFSRPNNRLEEVSFIHRFRLEKRNPNAVMSDPVEPVVYWIDPATPEWLQPWIVSGVNAWQPAFENAGFSNAIFGRVAPTPEEDPDFSLYDARHSVIYWRPSTVANATGGQTVDPRTGEILKGEVNMYHNIMDLQKNWYFIQVGPLDERAQQLPLPDSLMGELVEYVVAHEIGHSIGFPHNMKASAMYPADSIRSASFLERMGGHVATLMDYSRFNYVAQPEDNIPPELLIPRIGPYDMFAVKWGYAPIPGATTPDEERPTLDQWARQQDDMPWLRFTTPDARGSDPYALTEAVGDEDAVKSTRLGMRNLERVMDMMLRVAERPMSNYDELEELYGQAVGQWGRYMGHVAAIVGGAYTQERYGTGTRFTPLEKARQREAVRYLNETAFHVPDMFLDAEILRRIENEGVVERFRVQQARVINSLLNQNRLKRLVEFEATAANPANEYTITDLMSDMRAGIWDELDDRPVRINAYRRNLQRSFLSTVDNLLNPSEAALERPFNPAVDPATTDARAVLMAELEDIDGMAERALSRAGNPITRAHLRDVRREIARIVNPD